VLALNDARSFRVRSFLSTEVLENGGVRNTEGSSNIRQVLDVHFHTIESTLLLQSQLRHFVPVAWIADSGGNVEVVCHCCGCSMLC